MAVTRFRHKLLGALAAAMLGSLSFGCDSGSQTPASGSTLDAAHAGGGHTTPGAAANATKVKAADGAITPGDKKFLAINGRVLGKVAHFRGRVIRAHAKRGKFFVYVVKTRTGRTVAVRVGKKRHDGSDVLQSLDGVNTKARFAAYRSKLNPHVYFLRHVTLSDGQAALSLADEPADVTSDVDGEVVADVSCADNGPADAADRADDATGDSAGEEPDAADIEGAGETGVEKLSDTNGEDPASEPASACQPGAATPPVVTPPAAVTPVTPPVVPPAAVTDRLLNDQVLGQGQKLTSPSGRYVALLQTDGNFVVYDNAPGGGAIFATNTGGKPQITVAKMQSDGNFVLYAADGHYFDTGTGGRTGSFALLMQDDGNLVLVVIGGPALWSSKTGLIK